MKILAAFIAGALATALLSGACVAKSTFVLQSDSFKDGGTIPHEHAYNDYGCTGKNTSPELRWAGAPAETKSFALTIFDPDAGNGKGWWHWAVYGIDPATRELAAGEPYPGLESKNDFNTPGYGGPCPPPGDEPHHYIFTLYALDTPIGGKLSGPELLDAIKGHVLAKAVLVGRFGRK